MNKSESQNHQMYATIMHGMIRFTAFLTIIAIFTVAFLFGCKALEKKRITEYNARLEELCEWIDGYEIVNVENNVSVSSSTSSWTITKLNNGEEETITVEEDMFKRACFNTCPISSLTRVSPDNKYHIVEDNNRLVIYRPNGYYNTVNKSAHSSK